MDPKDHETIVGLLNEVKEDIRDLKRADGFYQSNTTVLSGIVDRLAKNESIRDQRIAELERRSMNGAFGVTPSDSNQMVHIPHAPRSPSFTNEVNEVVSSSIQAASMMQMPVLETIANVAQSMHQSQTKGARRETISIISQVTTGVILAMAILAYIAFSTGGGHHQ